MHSSLIIQYYYYCEVYYEGMCMCCPRMLHTHTIIIYIYYLHNNVLIFSYHVLVILNYNIFGTAVTQKRLQRETRRRERRIPNPRRGSLDIVWPPHGS